MDPSKLLEQFLGDNAQGMLQQTGSKAGQIMDRMGGLSGFAGGAAAEGLLTLLLGNKKARKMAGGIVGYGGAAALGALAYKAYENWRQGQNAASAPVATPSDIQQTDPAFLPAARPAANGQPFELALVCAMIGAAKADGHVDGTEQKLLFEQVDKLDLDAEAKAFVFDALAKPVDMAEIAAAAQSQEQAAELYLASRIAIDPDQAAEKAYLEALAHRLKLPAELVTHLDRQVLAALPAPAT
ncbi:tellurite resistance TerB family protein [Bradyrhizobium australiense]|uniref:Tellurite resistance TerB family protein n=1 Tax=Bradyrhizobium australiense TaxID=2721161 RepID=A0A7Y4GN83_9BRAD|nr:tellurite resistance TerB family protein [Bradyrhizobium australiense]NOJ38427.1 tellurite resistance TerB family protein [Bradyrhizobium australiense]